MIVLELRRHIIPEGRETCSNYCPHSTVSPTSREHEPLFSAKAYGHGYSGLWSRNMSRFGHNPLLCVSSGLLVPDLLAFPKIRVLNVVRVIFSHNYRTIEEDPRGEQHAEP
jgi:hypothetical protein